MMHRIAHVVKGVIFQVISHVVVELCKRSSLFLQEVLLPFAFSLVLSPKAAVEARYLPVVPLQLDVEEARNMFNVLTDMGRRQEDTEAVTDTDVGTVPIPVVVSYDHGHEFMLAGARWCRWNWKERLQSSVLYGPIL